MPSRRRKKVGKWRQSDDVLHTPQQQQRKGRRERRADTNIVSIKFNTLVMPSNMHTGDAVYCTSCRSILSHISEIKTEDDSKVWTCEFCGERNVIDVEDEEVPKVDDVTFMLEPALSTTASGPKGTDESLIVFCIDISGSMCQTTEVPGKIQLRGSANLHSIQRMQEDRSDQYLPNQKRNVTYVSRLQAVQAAVDHQVEEMMKTHPNRRVAIISFNNEIQVIGDGKGEPVIVAGDKLNDKDQLISIGTDLGMPGSVKDTRLTLGEKIFGLEEGGATALGPALIVATSMASQHLGSKVIICTDGLANVGLGRLDNLQSVDDEAAAGKFYEDIGNLAVSKGVCVSVTSIKGTNCKLVHLGKLADVTGGQVNIVDPLKLTQEFSTILANNIIATNVVATFIIHKQLFFHFEETEESKVVRNIGNVTADTEITFEYGVRTKHRKAESEDTKQSETGDTKPDEQKPEESGATAGPSTAGKDKGPDKLPFQLQIQYTDTDGAKALRVLTQVKPVTWDRKIAENKMNLDVLGKHTAHVSGQLAMEGLYTQSRSKALMNQRLAWRFTNHSEEGRHHRKSYKAMFGKIKSVENHINAVQMNERCSNSGRTYSDSEDSDAEDDVPDMKRSMLVKKSKKKLNRRVRECSDEVYEAIYDCKDLSQFKKK